MTEVQIALIVQLICTFNQSQIDYANQQLAQGCGLAITKLPVDHLDTPL